MEFKQAQKDMDFAYFGGATGVVISGLIWCFAGLIAVLYSTQASMLTLFIGGMFIHPLAMLLSKVLKRPGQHDSTNPLGKLALESTVILFVGFFIAFYVSKLHLQWFYPIMLLAVGVRYLIFNTLYGAKVYWLLGAVLMLAGVVCILLNANFVIGAFVGSITEVIFSIVIFNKSISRS
ncbi:hypothetical protein B1F84_08360 [Pseudoalteromonas sp. DL-6]|nr:hypothetical protein B1F84_08360 [Pseudoalteromonas sp. DL-6]